MPAPNPGISRCKLSMSSMRNFINRSVGEFQLIQIIKAKTGSNTLEIFYIVGQIDNLALSSKMFGQNFTRTNP